MVAKFVVFLAFLALAMAQAGMERHGVPNKEYLELSLQQAVREYENFEKNIDDLHKADPELAIKKSQLEAAAQEIVLKLREANLPTRQ